MAKGGAEGETRDLAVNRQARHDFVIEETFEGGLVLLGTEVKSARYGRVQIKDAYGRIKDGEAWLVGLHIAPWSHAYRDNHEPERRRKILLHRHEIKRLIGKTERAGYTLVPLRVYLKGTRVKVELGLGKGKAKGEKREDLKKRIQEREMKQEVAARRRGR